MIRQALYDGVLGARGVFFARKYVNDNEDWVYDDKAYTITGIYQGGQLKIYAIHPMRPLSGRLDRPWFVMTQIGSYALSGSPKSFREGAGAYRNAMKSAEEQRDQIIADANMKAAQTRSAPAAAS